MLLREIEEGIKEVFLIGDEFVRMVKDRNSLSLVMRSVEDWINGFELRL